MKNKNKVEYHDARYQWGMLTVGDNPPTPIAPKDKNYFDYSDAKKKRIIKKAARDGAEMQREMWAKAIRKQAITDAIEALALGVTRTDGYCIACGCSRCLDGRTCVERLFARRIAALKEREGIVRAVPNMGES